MKKIHRFLKHDLYAFHVILCVCNQVIFMSFVLFFAPNHGDATAVDGITEFITEMEMDR